MKFTKTEIEELKAIHDYLLNRNAEISTLGFDLYMNNYADKFAYYIERPREWSLNPFYLTNRKDFVCDFKDDDGHLTICCDLSWSIYNALILYGYDPFK